MSFIPVFQEYSKDILWDSGFSLHVKGWPLNGFILKDRCYEEARRSCFMQSDPQYYWKNEMKEAV